MIYIIKLLIATLVSTSVLANEPQSVSMDPRIRTLQYQENTVYGLRGLHGYHTTVQLNEDEVIQNIDLGDSSAWTLNASGNVLTLKPITDHADTNMTIRTDKRLYIFQLTTPPLKRDENNIPIFAASKDAIFLVRFIYPSVTLSLGEARPRIVTGIVTPPTKVHNRYYSARGDATILPRAVYDDGQFTYFDYSGIQPIPNMYLVDKKRHEYVVNKRMEGEWAVVEGISKQYTLRHGNQVASIFNDMTVRR